MNSIKKGIDAIIAAFSMFPITAIINIIAPSKYVRLLPANIFAGYILNIKKAINALTMINASIHATGFP